jgi:L-gulonolactone oxidase
MMQWSNWAGTAVAAPKVIHRPTDLDGIVAAVRAAADAGRRIRPLGSGHSFTPIAATDEHAVDLSGYTGVVDVNMAARQVTVRAGTTLRELNRILDALGLALENMGDIDKQTISGAISTGTHGTGATFGGLATQVAALELVTADGSVVRCSPHERPDLFAAARVGLGALGILSTVTINCVPSFVLAAQEAPDRLDAVLERFDDEAEGNDHFEFYWFPHSDKTLIKRNNRVPAGEPPRPLSKARQYVEYGLIENQLFGAVCRMLRAAPRLTKPTQRVMTNVLSERRYSDVSHRVFVTSRDVRFVESEYAVPHGEVVNVLQELRAAAAKLSYPVAFPIEIRVAAPDDIWLSTGYQRANGYIAVHQFQGMRYDEYFAAFESIVNNVGGRPHWGKMHTLGAETLRGRYPKFDEFLAVRKTVDPDGLFTNDYLDRVLGQP